MATPANALARLLEALDKLEISYEVGGSIASSIHGIPRTSADADFIVDLPRDRVEEFAAELSGEFYLDRDTIRDALDRGRSFNLIHFKSAFKFDLFPLGRDDYSRVEFARRRYAELAMGGEPIECAVASAEDTILRKLEWYRAGGELSERQWNDLRGIVSVSGQVLDFAYLRKWSSYLKLADLLERLLAERY